ncbi:outer membrane protein assembly factor BamD [Segetibacter sp.]|uniref:outer membrane protein assembly factor BamD n=1 Tax=Segetibacter sp. TaxID=2231182 RepID=UPI00261877C4|nr:outer membrane protein assembly factor BamD [Segetibacter sp.]
MAKYAYVLFLIIIFSSCSNKLSKTLKSTDNEYKLKMAENYYAQKKYNNAQLLFEDLFPVFKGTARFEDLYYKYAYSAYYLKDYVTSENLFKTFVETFPNSTKAEEADFMRAFCYHKQSPKAELDQTNTTKAMGQMQAFINTHPLSARVAEATSIIDEARAKLEVKDFKSAELYYNLGFYKAAAIAFSALIDNYPDTGKGDEYKLMVIKSYYLYANNSIEERQSERYDKVVSECTDFIDRFPESKLAKTVDFYKTQSLNNINLKNEQTKKAA